MGREFGRPTYNDFMGVAAAVGSIDRTLDRATRRQWDREDRELSKEGMADHKYLMDEMAGPGLKPTYSGFDPSAQRLALKDTVTNRKNQLDLDTKFYEEKYGHYTPDDWAKFDFEKTEKPQAAYRAMVNGIKQHSEMTNHRENSRANDDAQSMDLFRRFKGQIADMWTSHVQGNDEVAIEHAKKLLTDIPTAYRFRGTTDDGKVKIGIYEEGQLLGEEAMTIEQLYRNLDDWSQPEFSKYRRAFNLMKSEYNNKSALNPAYFYKDGEIISVSGFMDDSGNHYAVVWSDDGTMRPLNMAQIREDGWQPIAMGRTGSRAGSRASSRSGSGKYNEKQAKAEHQILQGRIFSRAMEHMDPHNAEKPLAFGLELDGEGNLAGVVDSVAKQKIIDAAKLEGAEVYFEPAEYDPKGWWSLGRPGWKVTGVFADPAAQRGPGAPTNQFGFPGVQTANTGPSADTGPSGGGAPSGKPDFKALTAEIVGGAGGKAEPDKAPKGLKTSPQGTGQDDGYLQKLARSAAERGSTRPASVPVKMWEQELKKYQRRQGVDAKKTLVKLAMRGKSKPQGVTDAQWQWAKSVAARQHKGQERFMPEEQR